MSRAAITGVRGSQKDTDQNPEGKYQTLEKYGTDLTARAREGTIDPVIGRDEEIRRVLQVLSRRTKNNPVLIGEPGVGKTAVVEGLAQRIVAGDVAESLKDKELVTLDISALVAGAMYRGQFEERLKSVLKEITESDGRIITFIDELHVLMGAGGGEGSVAASNMLKPMLARGELRLIGATTLNEYREFIEKDAALERRFQQVYVGEPSVEDTVAILRGLKERYEAHHRVAIADPRDHAVEAGFAGPGERGGEREAHQKQRTPHATPQVRHAHQASAPMASSQTATISTAPHTIFGSLSLLASASASRACHSASGVSLTARAMPIGSRTRSSSKPSTGMKSGIRSMGLSA